MYLSLCTTNVHLHIFSESFDDTDVERKDSAGEVGGNKGDFFS